MPSFLNCFILLYEANG